MSVRLVATLAVVFCIFAAAPVHAVEFISNGTFEGGSAAAVPPKSCAQDGLADTLPTGWTRWETFPGVGAENSLITPVVNNGPSVGGATAMQHQRGAGGASGDKTQIRQALNISAAMWQTLTLSMDVQVTSHNLEAGGWVTPAFEWPVIVQIDYTDLANNPQIWRYGWYLDPPGDFVAGQVNDPGQGLIPIYNDQPVPVNQWVTTTFDLYQELPQLQTVTGIWVGGSGWNFDGLVDNVSLQGEIPEPVTSLLLGAGAAGLLLKRRRK